MAGPAIEAVSKPLLFHDTALPKISSGTIRGRNAPRAGIQNARAAPTAKMRTYMKTIAPSRVEFHASPRAASVLNATAPIKTRLRL